MGRGSAPKVKRVGIAHTTHRRRGRTAKRIDESDLEVASRIRALPTCTYPRTFSERFVKNMKPPC
jgi:hypothetical protein